LSSNDPTKVSFLYGNVYENKLLLTYSEVTPVPEADTSAMLLAGVKRRGK